MNQRNVCIAGLAAVAAMLSGCAAQYRNPNSCVAEMRSRLDGTPMGSLTVTNRAVSYRGQRVVIEGRFEQTGAPTGASNAASNAGANAASERAQTPATALAGSGTETAPAASASPLTTSVASATSPARSPAADGKAAAVVAAASAAGQPQAHPTTPIGALVAHFSHSQKRTPVAAECTFDESGLTSFRWLAPAALAKTTPAPAHGG